MKEVCERRKKSLRNSTALNSVSENYFSLLTLLFGLDVLEIHEGNSGSRLGYQALTRESEPVLLPVYRGGMKAGPDRAAEIEPALKGKPDQSYT